MSQITTKPHIFNLLPEILEIIFVHHSDALDRTMVMYTCCRLHDIIRGNDKTHTILNSRDMYLTSAKNGYFSIYHWALKRYCVDIHDLAHAAISGGQLRFLKYLYMTQRYRPREIACELAIKHDHLEILKWLRGYTDYGWVAHDAFMYGRLNIIKWAAERGIIQSCDGYLAVSAGRGYLKVLQWFHETKRGTFDESLCRAASRGNQLEVLKWLRSVGCPWDALVRRIIPSRGNAETVQWAIDNGCP